MAKNNPKHPVERDAIAREFGISFGTSEQNKNLTTVQCGAVGGEIVKRALAGVKFN